MIDFQRQRENRGHPVACRRGRRSERGGFLDSESCVSCPFPSGAWDSPGIGRFRDHESG